MSRRILAILGLVSLVLVISSFRVSFAAENKPADATKTESPATEEVKADPMGTVPQQFKHIEQLQRTRPALAEEYVKLQEQVQQTADKILAKAKEGTDEYKKAYLTSRGAKIRTLSLVEKEEQDAIAKLLMDEVNAKKSLDLVDAQLGMGLAQGLERSQRDELAGAAYMLYGERLAKSEDEQLAEISEMFLGAGRRLTLVGNPMKITGTTVEGKAFDLAELKGKVVLVDFWATWCGPCVAEYPNIVKNYETYRERGFEVVGVSLDQNRAALEAYVEKNKVPWTTLHDEENGGRHPAAVYYGINGIPAMYLIGKDGNVVSMAARGPQLDSLLAELLGQPDPQVETDKPKAEGEEGASTTSPQQRNASYQPEYFTSAPAPEEEETEAAEAGEDKDDASPLSEEPINPYSAPRGMTTARLVDYIFSMEEKPRTIQERPGFADAVIDAGERLMKDAKSGIYWRLGALAKFQYLHKKASLKDKEADKQLAAFVDEMKDSEDKRIAKEVRFLTLERKAMQADELPLEEIPQLLTELDEFFSSGRLTERHLRIASATIQAVNRLDSEDEKEKAEYLKQREKYFTSFGELFAKSTDQELSQYGKKLAKKPEAEASELVGKPLELDGTTFEGSEFDWKAYRGKVVLVDFWATWCGPCIREMPNVRALYDGNKDKGFTVVGVSLDKDLEKLGQFITDNKVPWTNLAGDGTQKLAKKYGVRGIPTMMLVDRDGKIVGVSHNVAALSKKAEELLAKPAESKEEAKPEKQAG